ncbi:MAG: hypothetical protein HS111_30655 [Kofleriaceae bacterium]|nr:hypothetical protein [Kofleriaceae bacterium]
MAARLHDLRHHAVRMRLSALRRRAHPADSRVAERALATGARRAGRHADLLHHVF